MVYHTVSTSSVIKKKLCLPLGEKISAKTNKCVEVRWHKINLFFFFTGACFQESQFNFAFYFIFCQCLTITLITLIFFFSHVLI